MSYLLGAVQRMPRGTSSRDSFIFAINRKTKQDKKKQKNQPPPQPASAATILGGKGYTLHTQKKEVPSPPRWARKFETIEDEPRFKGLVETLTLKVSSRRNRRSSSQGGKAQDTVLLC